MAKTNIIFNNNTYSIDDSSLSAEKSKLEQHLSTTMNGTGAVISLGGIAYNIDSAKLTTARNAFISHLGTISGNGKKIVIGGVEYSVGSDKVAVAIGELEAVLGGLNSGSDSGETYTAGLYQTGAIALYEEQGADAIEGMMIKSWDELLADGTVGVDDGVVYTPFDPNESINPSSDALVGDLLLPYDGSVTELGNAYWDDSIWNDYGEEYGDFVGYFAFTNCEKLTGILIPESVTSIGESALNYCLALTDITLPNSVINIDARAFAYCSKLTDVILSNNFKIISEEAFVACESLKSINIPDSITSIGGSAFAYCTNLTSINFEGTMAQWNDIDLGEWWNDNVPATKVVCSDGEVAL